MTAHPRVDGHRLRFREIVIAPERVRSAFPAPSFLRAWWSVLLRLHGKPACCSHSVDESAACVAAGFRFYGVLYASLGVVLLLASVATARLAVAFDAGYWPLMGGVAGIYLLAAASVARAGAEAYVVRREHGVFVLTLFLGMVGVFLAMFLGFAGSAAEQLGLVPAWMNVATIWGMVVFGLGSYAIELVYLVHVAFETKVAGKQSASPDATD